MEKDLFPLRQTDLPPSALSRMDGMADGGCGCTKELTNGDRRDCRCHEGCGADSWVSPQMLHTASSQSSYA